MKRRIGAALILLIVLISMMIPVLAEDSRAWILCQSYVNLRTEPTKESSKCGFLDHGDSFTTSGESRNGYLQVLDAGECSCWVHAGYVVDAEPVEVNEYYVVVAKQQVICRQYVNGPKIKGRRGVMKNGSRVKVYWIAGDWALTARGYVQSEWLEVDPD